MSTVPLAPAQAASRGLAFPADDLDAEWGRAEARRNCRRSWLGRWLILPGLWAGVGRYSLLLLPVGIVGLGFLRRKAGVGISRGLRRRGELLIPGGLRLA